MTNEEAIMILKAMIDDMILVFDRDRKKVLNMAIEALKEQPEHSQNTSSKQPDLETFGIKTGETCADAISRQAAIDAVEKESQVDGAYGYMDTKSIVDLLNDLPSAQQDGIPLEWINKHLEWLDNCDNDFAQLAKVGIRAMVELWKKDRI